MAILPRVAIILALALFAPASVFADARYETPGACVKPGVPKRVALVVGNSAYRSLTELKNPGRDARAVAETLCDYGYDVLFIENATRAQFQDALVNFRRSFAPAATEAFVFYAGHGLSSEGRDVIAPVDMTYDCPENAKEPALYGEVPVDDVIRAIRDVPKSTVVLDACRRQPFKSCARGDVETSFRGLSRLAPGTLIVNSTSPGQLAADGEAARGSPFARKMLERLKAQPGDYYRDLFDEVARDVAAATGGNQVPDVLARGGAPKMCLSGACGQQVAAVKPVEEAARPEKPKEPSHSMGGYNEDNPFADLIPTKMHPYLAGGYEDKEQGLVRTFILAQSWNPFRSSESIRVNAVAFSPDGRIAFSGVNNGTIQSWDLNSGQLIRTLDASAKSVNCLALSSDGRLVASGGEDRTIKIWEVTTGKLIRTLEGTKEAIQTIQFSPDDRLLLSGSGDFLSDRDGELSIWGVLSGQKSRFYIGFKGPVFSAAFSKDGQFVVSAGGDGQVYLWDARSEKLLSIYHGHRFQVQGVRFGHNPNAFISAGSEGVLNLWAKDKLFPLKTIKTNPGGTRALAISNDNRFLVSGGCGGGENGCQQGSIFLGTFDKEIATHEILGHLKYVTSVAISPDGKFVLSGSEDGTMKLWDVSEWTQPREARQ